MSGHMNTCGKASERTCSGINGDRHGLCGANAQRTWDVNRGLSADFHADVYADIGELIAAYVAVSRDVCLVWSFDSARACNEPLANHASRGLGSRHVEPPLACASSATDGSQLLPAPFFRSRALPRACEHHCGLGAIGRASRGGGV